MPIPGNLLTTAMAVMPHTDVDRALELALSLDIPFWPQLPNYNYYEDMYVQAAENFPGILLDLAARTLRFSMDKFILELEDAMAHFDDPAFFDVSETYSVVYHRFLTEDGDTRLHCLHGALHRCHLAAGAGRYALSLRSWDQKYLSLLN